MKLKAQKITLLDALYYAQGIADRKATMPILANVLLRTDGDNVTVAATDLNLTVTSEVAANISEPGEVTVSAKHLHDIVKGLGDEVEIETLSNGQLAIRSGRAVYKVASLPARDFPKLPKMADVVFARVDASVMRDMIAKTFFSVSSDETRSHLNGVLFECLDDSARMVSTDGHRLSLCERPLPGAQKMMALIPRRGLVEIRRALDDAGSVEIALHDFNVFVRTGATTLSVRINEASFPPWQQVVPKSSEREVVVKTAELLSSMKRIMLVASEKTHGVRLAVSDGQIAIETDNPDLGDGRELLDAKLSGTPITIGFSGRYLIDVLQEIQTPEVRISLGNDLDPAMIAPVDDGKDGNRALFVIMPMRL